MSKNTTAMPSQFLLDCLDFLVETAAEKSGGIGDTIDHYFALRKRALDILRDATARGDLPELVGDKFLGLVNETKEATNGQPEQVVRLWPRDPSGEAGEGAGS